MNGKYIGGVNVNRLRRCCDISEIREDDFITTLDLLRFLPKYLGEHHSRFVLKPYKGFWKGGYSVPFLFEAVGEKVEDVLTECAEKYVTWRRKQMR